MAKENASSNRADTSARFIARTEDDSRRGRTPRSFSLPEGEGAPKGRMGEPATQANPREKGKNYGTSEPRPFSPPPGRRCPKGG